MVAPLQASGRATVKRFYYESHDQLSQHLADFVSAYNFGMQSQLQSCRPAERLVSSVLEVISAFVE